MPDGSDPVNAEAIQNTPHRQRLGLGIQAVVAAGATVSAEIYPQHPTVRGEQRRHRVEPPVRAAESVQQQKNRPALTFVPYEHGCYEITRLAILSPRTLTAMVPVPLNRWLRTFIVTV
jgi:hypothetical protein